VIQCIPLDEIAYCSNDRNSDTISIECCHPGEDGAFTDATYRSLIRLLRTLCDEYDLGEEDLIRHYDVTGKDCPKYYVDNPDAWEQLKSDVFDPNFSVDESD
jgi:N-acetylmuramoyl-L-alanine amidase CwlA